MVMPSIDFEWRTHFFCSALENVVISLYRGMRTAQPANKEKQNDCKRETEECEGWYNSYDDV